MEKGSKMIFIFALILAIPYALFWAVLIWSIYIAIKRPKNGKLTILKNCFIVSYIIMYILSVVALALR
jgi:cation transporter-like permease